ncbi:MAG: cysteine--tRNA ligase [Phycisphaerae bacterium]|jgi:cysteinyl-tRNA synthetase|nr:cysteine--tRNA ligase [Phycisphaerae bacterium]
MALQVYNTLTRRKEAFEPLHPPFVGIYVCGPTVYGHAHIGHAKSYASFDVIVRYLRSLYEKVLYVQNITDVGHLTDDADEGEDKIEKRAAAEKVQPMALAETYTQSYFEDMDALGNLRPDISPRASGHIIEQIELVKKLLDGGNAYEANGSVYFDVSSFPAYGKLSGRKVEEMEAGARVAVHPDKRHPADFALWKKAEPEHIMKWPSPWGDGYPGWHVECSVMSQKYIGETIDIHGGGLENVFPHHDCEIAQSEAANGKPFVRYWLHNNMVTVDGQKMGKSLGNFITLKDAFKKWDPMVIRLFILQSHYRSPLDFSAEALNAAQTGCKRLTAAVLSVRKALATASEGLVDEAVANAISQYRARFTAAMDDDFNTPGAVAVLFDLARQANTWLEGTEQAKGSLEAIEGAFRDLGGKCLGIVKDEYPELDRSQSALQDKLIRLLIDMRKEARTQKDFDAADKIRNQLHDLGVQLDDGRKGTTYRLA